MITFALLGLLSIGSIIPITAKAPVNNNSQIEKPLPSNTNEMSPIKVNKYYIIYIKQNNGTGSSFVPLELNPGFKNDSDYNLNISFDDNGNIINSEKIIVIDNFLISEENKEMIKKRAGGNYDAAEKNSGSECSPSQNRISSAALKNAPLSRRGAK